MNKIATMLAAMGGIFSKEITPTLLAGYSLALSDYSEADILRVSKTLMKGKFFPRPYDFIQAIEGPKVELPDLATLRWAEIVAWLWTDAKFPDDPIALKIVEGLGDRFMFRNCTKAELDAHGWTFRRAYAAAVTLQASTAAESAQIESEAIKQIAETLSHKVAMEGRVDG